MSNSFTISYCTFHFDAFSLRLGERGSFWPLCNFLGIAAPGASPLGVVFRSVSYDRKKTKSKKIGNFDLS